MSDDKKQHSPEAPGSSRPSYRGYSGGLKAQEMKPPTKVPSSSLSKPKKKPEPAADDEES